MDPLTIGTGATIGLGALKSGFGVLSAFGQRDDERAALREKIRRMRAQNAQDLGMAKALGASDEFGLSGSLPGYLQQMASEMERQVAWTRRAGQRSSDLGFAGSLFGAATDFGGAMLRAGEMNKWWTGAAKPAASGVPYYLARP